MDARPDAPTRDAVDAAAAGVPATFTRPVPDAAPPPRRPRQPEVPACWTASRRASSGATAWSLPPTPPPAGCRPPCVSARYFGEAEVVLAPGDTCLLCSDGVVEARGSGDFFGGERPAATLPYWAGAPAAVVCEHLEQTVVSWLGGHDHDDVALLAIHAPGSAT